MNTRLSVSTGFQEDCAKLISRFDQVDDIRFQTFTEIWKDLKFSLIFKGKRKMAEFIEFCEEVLYISKRYLFSTEFKERICGLYLVYAIYYKMPLTQFKIRVKLADWQSIMDLHNQIKEGEHLDANYILSKLVVDNAFQYCLFDYEYILEKDLRERNYQSSNPYSVLPFIKNMTESDLFAKISTLSSIYQKSKCQASTSNTENSGLNLFNSTFVNNIINDIHELDKNRQMMAKKCQSNPSKNIIKKVQKLTPDDGKRQKDSRSINSGESENDELQINVLHSDSESLSD